MRTDSEMALAFQRAKTQFGPLAPTDCDENCRRSSFCETREDTYLHYKICMGEPVKSFKEDPLSALLESLMDPWYVKTDFFSFGDH